MIRVAIADDQGLIRAGFRSLLEAEPDIDIVGEAGTGAEIVQLVKREKPDVVLMDIRMPDGDGLWATEQIVADPRLSGTHIVIVTTFELDEYVGQAIRAAKRRLQVIDIPGDEPAREGGERKLQVLKWGAAYMWEIWREIFIWR